MTMSPTGAAQDLVALLLADEPSVVVGPTYDEDQATPGQTYVAVTMLPGAGDRLNARPIYDVSVFSPRYATSERIALKLDKGLMGYPFRVGSDENVAVVDSVNAVTYPAEVEWSGDSTIRRFLATYELVFRR